MFCICVSGTNERTLFLLISNRRTGSNRREVCSVRLEASVGKPTHSVSCNERDNYRVLVCCALLSTVPSSLTGSTSLELLFSFSTRCSLHFTFNCIVFSHRIHELRLNQSLYYLVTAADKMKRLPTIGPPQRSVWPQSEKELMYKYNNSPSNYSSKICLTHLSNRRLIGIYTWLSVITISVRTNIKLSLSWWTELFRFCLSHMSHTLSLSWCTKNFRFCLSHIIICHIQIKSQSIS